MNLFAAGKGEIGELIEFEAISQSKTIGFNEKLSLTSLPNEILHEIIFHLTYKTIDFTQNRFKSDIPQYLFSNNRYKYGVAEVYDDLISLSSTCVYFRVKLAPILFEYLSLVRCNEVDTLLENPGGFEMFSDAKTYERMFMKEILNTNFTECSKADLAKSSYKLGVVGERFPKSRYRELISCCNYVKTLECGNDVLRSGDVRLFPRMECLKILDRAVTESNSVPIDTDAYNNLECLNMLSISLSTLINVHGVVNLLTKIERLNLFCDFNQLEPNYSFDQCCELVQELFSHKNANRLKELNLFVNESCCLIYESVLTFLESFRSHFINLTNFNIRMADRRSGILDTRTGWTICDSKTYQARFKSLFTGLSQMPKLKHFGFDIKLLSPLSGYLDLEMLNESIPRKKESFSLTVVDKLVDSLSGENMDIAEYIVKCFGVTDLHYEYSQVMEIANLYAYHNATSFINHIASPRDDPHELYLNINKLSVEKGWSIIQNGEIRNFFEKQLELYFTKAANELSRQLAKSNVASASTYKLPSSFFGDPLYRKREYLQLTYAASSSINTLPGTIPRNWDMTELKSYDENQSSIDSSTSFWLIESYLKEMEQYCLNRKPLSSLWA